MFTNFFMNWNNVSFFQIFDKNTCKKWVLENHNVSGWAIESAQILITFTEIPSWPCVLLTSEALISFLTSLLAKQIVLIRSFVIYDIFSGKTLLLGIGGHCFAKKELKTLPFSWNSVTNLLLIKNGGMIGTFLPFRDLSKYFN